MIHWFTGQAGHGKTVLAKLLMEKLNQRDDENFKYVAAFHIDGDDLREIFNNKDYSKEGRLKNVLLAQNLAHFLHNKGCNVVVSLVSPYREQREEFKEKLRGDIVEYYVHTTETRGRENFHVDYESPENNFIDIDTTNITPEETLKIITI